MADLNALIAQGVQFKEPPDPFAQYAQMQQLTQGVQANQLNQMKMQEYQRGLQEQEGVRNYLKVTPNFDPTNPTHQTGLMQVAPTTAPKLLESFLTTRKTVADIGKSTAETGELAAKTLDANLANFNKFYSPISAAAAGPQGVQDYITALYGDPILGSVAARMKPLDVAVKENLAAYQADPKNWVAAHSNINGEQILNTLKGTSQTTNFGGTSQQQTIDAFGRPVAGTQVSTTMTPTPGEISTARTAAASLEQAAQIANRPVFSEGAGGYIPQYPVGAGAARTGAVAAPQVPGAAPQAPGATPPGLIPLPGVIGTTRANQAERIRGDIDKAVKPLDDMQQRLTGIQQLLATGTPLANTQIQQALTGVMNDARPYGNLMKENENFGDLQGRVSGFFSQKFAGTYSDEQRRQIQQMVTDLQNKVVTPVRDRIVQQQQNIGAAMNIPASLLPAPVGYGNSAAVPTATGPNGAKLYLRGGQWVNQ